MEILGTGIPKKKKNLETVIFGLSVITLKEMEIYCKKILNATVSFLRQVAIILLMNREKEMTVCAMHLEESKLWKSLALPNQKNSKPSFLFYVLYNFKGNEKK